MRIAFHAINGVGLGHLVRTTTIALEIRAIHPRASLLVLTNAADTSRLEAEGIDFVRLPPRLADPHADPDRVRRSLPSPLEHAALAGALRAFRPDLVVFDTHAPPALARFAAAVGARTVLVQRELRRRDLAAFFAGEAPLAFDRIVVPHDPSEVDLSGAAHLPVVATGHVVRRLDTRTRARSNAPRVVMMAGGGGQPVDARRFLQAAADAHVLARARVPDLSTLLVLGPYGEAPAHAAAIPGLSVTGACPHLPAMLAGAEVVVSQAGYNSVAELRALAKPAILVPGHRKAESQRARARRVAKAGAAVLAEPEARSIADPLEALLLDADKREAMIAAHRRHPLLPGNRATAEAVLRPIAAPRQVRRVVLVAHELGPRIGGMETVARTIALGLSSAAVDVRVYAKQHLCPEAADPPGGVVRRIYPPGLDLWGDLLLTLDALLSDVPDAIHLCNAGLAPWVPALQAAFPAAVTISVHGNDLLSPWVRHGGDPATYRVAQERGLGAADAVFPVSSFSAELCRKAGVPASRRVTLESSVDCARFSPERPSGALAERLGIAPDDEVILTVSRLVRRKGHATAIRALSEVARRHPKALYVFTGTEPVLSGELDALARELGVRDRVRPVGVLPDADLPALFRLARVFVLLSEQSAEDVEGFGVALLEAAASALPVVGARTGGIPEAMVDGSTGLLVAPGDAGDAARAIAAILDDPVRARAMGARGRTRAAERFSPPAQTRILTDRWNAILKRGLRPRPLRGFSASFDGGTHPTASARMASERAALRSAASGVALVRLAQQTAFARRRASDRRRATFAKILGKGGTVRLRAFEEGASLLVESLSACAALGHEPIVETKLRRFLEPDFQAYALPLIRCARLAQVVPFQNPKAVVARVAALPPEAFAKIDSVRLFLSPEAEESLSAAVAAVPAIHALARIFAARRVRLDVPPELARYLLVAPPEGPSTGMIEPTNVCNLACPTCPTGKGKIAPKPQMSVERFDAVVSALVPRLVTLALWNYGEPLLHRDLPAIIARAKARGVRVVKVSSNAHFLNGERGRGLLASGLDVLILCVDGASEETYQVFRKGGDFASVARQVAWICAEKKRLGIARPHIDLQFIVMRHNEHELDEIRRLAAEWGIDHLRIKTVGAEDPTTRYLVPTTKLLSRYREDGSHNASHPFCTMAWDHTVVNVDGSVTPCCYLRPDMGDEFIMGNVFETPFDEIWQGERYRAFREAMLDGRESMRVCNRCRGGTHDLFASIEEVTAP
jgi:radical SAM protein with 4Fe4S-binding SPASM domain